MRVWLLKLGCVTFVVGLCNSASVGGLLERYTIRWIVKVFDL